MDSLSSKIFAIIVGIDRYKNKEFPRLYRAVSDAQKLADLLIQDLKVPEKHVLQLYDEAATRKGIIDAIADRSEFKPGHALLFFFSGLAGRAEGDIGMICPVDINTESQTGISDLTLIQLFDQISRSYGNNITLLLDCDSNLFRWNDPDSFVVVSPEDATETEGDRSFTESLVDVLKLEEKSGRIRILTVESFAAKIQADKKSTVKCFGRNKDHLLFDRASGAHYPFIRGEAEIGKDIKLHAGLAHGIVPETRLAIFYSNVSDTLNKKVKLPEDLVVKSAGNTTSILHRSSDGGAPPLPSVFYAIETHYLWPEVEKTVKILIEGNPGEYSYLTEYRTICGAQKADEANLTLKFDDKSRPSLWWKVPTNVRDRKDNCQIFASFEFFYPFDGKDLKRFNYMLRKATRFAYHLLRVPPSSQSLYLQFQIGDLEIMNTDGTEGDPLKGGRVELSIKKDEPRGPFSLDIVNKSKNDLWLYVFLFNPSTLSISPLSSSSISDRQPVKADELRSFGSGNSNGLFFECPAWSEVDVSYIKVFGTTERTDFSFLEQRFQVMPTSTEDQLRELEVDPPVSHFLNKNSGDVKFGGRASWTTATLTIVRTLIKS